MRGVYKDGKYWVANYTNNNTRRSKYFKNQFEAYIQREKWEKVYGKPSRVTDHVGDIRGEWRIKKYLDNQKWLAESLISGRTRTFTDQTLNKKSKYVRSQENLTGKKIGNLKIIGSTGKHGANNSLIFVVKDQMDNFFTATASSLKKGTATGYRKSLAAKRISRKSMEELNNHRDQYLKKRGYTNGTVTWAGKMKVPYTNTSGVKGVSKIKKTSKWRAYIFYKGKQIHLGTFSDKQEAITARQEAEQKYFNNGGNN